MRGVKAEWANARHLTPQQEGLKHVIFSHPPKVSSRALPYLAIHPIYLASRVNRPKPNAKRERLFQPGQVPLDRPFPRRPLGLCDGGDERSDYVLHGHDRRGALDTRWEMLKAEGEVLRQDLVAIEKALWAAGIGALR